MSGTLGKRAPRGRGRGRGDASAASAVARGQRSSPPNYPAPARRGRGRAAASAAPKFQGSHVRPVPEEAQTSVLTELLARLDLGEQLPVIGPSATASSCSGSDFVPERLNIGKEELELFQRIKLSNQKAASADLRSFWSLGIEPSHPFHTAAVLVIKKFATNESHKNSFSVFVLKELSAWLNSDQARAEELRSRCLTPTFKTAVFKALGRVYLGSNIGLVVKLYQMKPMAQNFVPELKAIISTTRYFTYAVEIARELHLETEVPELLIPLLLEEKSSELTKFIGNNVELQKKFVLLLDDLMVDNSQKLRLLTEVHPDQNAVVCKRISGKPLARYISKTLDLYDFPDSFAPSFYAERKKSEFIYLLRQKGDKSMRQENWRDLIAHKVEGSRDLQLLLLTRFTTDGSYCDYDEAVYWARRWKMEHDEDIPYTLKREFEDLAKGIVVPKPAENYWLDSDSWSTQDEKDSDDCGSPKKSWKKSEENKFYRMPLDMSEVFFVDDRKSLYRAMKAVKAADVVGVDTEFMPVSLRSEEKISILQIGLKDRVFIIDIEGLLKAKDVNSKDWQCLIQDCFNNRDVLKLTYGFSADIGVFERTSEIFTAFGKHCERVLDLELLDRRSSSASEKVLQKPFPTKAKGLSGLVESLYGLPLDKRDQISNWSRRPLSGNQLRYAATDAFVLLEVFEKLRILAVEGEKEKKFHGLVNDLVRLRNKMPKNMKIRPPLVKESIVASSGSNNTVSNHKKRDPITASDLKVVCDNMLVALSRKLRLHGIDTVCLEHYESCENCIPLAEREGRMVITRSVNRFRILNKQLPPGHCLNLNSDVVDEQVAEVLKFFNVTVTEEDLLSRCSICNADNYLVFDNEVALAIRNTMSESNSNRNSDRSAPRDDKEQREGETLDKDIWKVISGYHVNTSTGVVRETGNALQLLSVAEGVLEAQKMFFGCAYCGKIYWHGSHWDKIRKKTNK